MKRLALIITLSAATTAQAQELSAPEASARIDALKQRINQLKPSDADIQRTRELGHFLRALIEVSRGLSQEDRAILMASPEVQQAARELAELTSKNIQKMQSVSHGN